MRIVIHSVLLMLILMSQSMAQPAPQQTWGLCIGIAEYTDPIPSLKWADKDAIEFSTFLGRDMKLPPENYRLLTNQEATRENILTHLKWLNDSVSPGDRVYIFFSGHGMPSSPFLPYDSHNLLSWQDIITVLGNNLSQEIIIFVDACYSGKLIQDSKKTVIQQRLTGLDRESIIGMAQAQHSVVIITSANGIQEAIERNGQKNGLFTHNLINTLTNRHYIADINHDKQLTLEEAFQEVYVTVKSQSSQQPQISDLEKAKQIVLLSIPSGITAPIRSSELKRMSTLRKSAIGVGSAVALGGGIALFVSGKKDSSNNDSEDDLPDLVVSALSVTSLTSNNLVYSYTIENIGTAPANLEGPTESSSDNVSVQAALSSDLIFYNEGDLAACGTIVGSSPLGDLPSGGFFTDSFHCTISVDPIITPYLLLQVDWGGSVMESDETNNVAGVNILTGERVR